MSQSEMKKWEEQWMSTSMNIQPNQGTVTKYTSYSHSPRVPRTITSGVSTRYADYEPYYGTITNRNRHSDVVVDRYHPEYIEEGKLLVSGSSLSTKVTQNLVAISADSRLYGSRIVDYTPRNPVLAQLMKSEAVVSIPKTEPTPIYVEKPSLIQDRPQVIDHNIYVEKPSLIQDRPQVIDHNMYVTHANRNVNYPIMRSRGSYIGKVYGLRPDNSLVRIDNCDFQYPQQRLTQYPFENPAILKSRPYPIVSDTQRFAYDGSHQVARIRTPTRNVGRMLDAADGVMDGRFYGTPIVNKDAADGVMDGRFYGTPIVNKASTPKQSVGRMLDAADGIMDGRFYGTPIVNKAVLPPKQSLGRVLDAADGVMDGRFYGTPIVNKVY